MALIHIISLERILELLKEQAAVRAPENDEGGCILDARKTLVESLNDLRRSEGLPAEGDYQ